MPGEDEVVVGVGIGSEEVAAVVLVGQAGEAVDGIVRVGRGRDFVRAAAVGVFEAGDLGELAERVVGKIDSLFGDRVAAPLPDLIDAGQTIQRIVGVGIQKIVRAVDGRRKTRAVARGVVDIGQHDVRNIRRVVVVDRQHPIQIVIGVVVTAVGIGGRGQSIGRVVDVADRPLQRAAGDVGRVAVELGHVQPAVSPHKGHRPGTAGTAGDGDLIDGVQILQRRFDFRVRRVPIERRRDLTQKRQPQRPPVGVRQGHRLDFVVDSTVVSVAWMFVNVPILVTEPELTVVWATLVPARLP